MSYRIRYDNKTFVRRQTGGAIKEQVICALLLSGVILFGARHSGLLKKAVTEVFQPGEMESIAYSYALGKSARQIFIDQCRQCLSK